MRLDSCLRLSASLYPRIHSAVFEDDAEVELFRLLAKAEKSPDRSVYSAAKTGLPALMQGYWSLPGMDAIPGSVVVRQSADPVFGNVCRGYRHRSFRPYTRPDCCKNHSCCQQSVMVGPPIIETMVTFSFWKAMPITVSHASGELTLRRIEISFVEIFQPCQKPWI